MTRQILDVTRPIAAAMPVWPGDPPVIVERVAGDDGGYPIVSRLCLSSHTGTHVDPPAHFLPDGATIDEISLQLLVGPAWLIHVTGLGPITAAALEAASIPPEAERLLIRTRNSEADVTRRPVFHEDFAALTPEAAEWVAASSIRLVGIDGPGIGPFGEASDPVHETLLSAGVIAVEGLDLSGVAPGSYDLICLPLLIERGDGAPARVLLIHDS